MEGDTSMSARYAFYDKRYGTSPKHTSKASYRVEGQDRGKEGGYHLMNVSKTEPQSNA